LIYFTCRRWSAPDRWSEGKNQTGCVRISLSTSEISQEGDELESVEEFEPELEAYDDPDEGTQSDMACKHNIKIRSQFEIQRVSTITLKSILLLCFSKTLERKEET